MTLEQSQVAVFMANAGQNLPKIPTIPDLDTRKLRATLILEEAVETVNALGFVVNFDYSDFEESDSWKPSLEWIADGLADLHYVGYCGTANACGLDMQPIFSEIHRSNMSKFIDGKKREDGKWEKGVSWTPPNLTSLIK